MATAIEAKDFQDKHGNMFTVEKLRKTDGSTETRVRITYLRGRYIGATFAIEDAKALIDLFDDAIAKAMAIAD